MNDTTAHNSKEFFIDGSMVNIRPLTLSDEIASTPYSKLLENHSFVTLGRLSELDNIGLYDYQTADQGYVYVAETENDETNNTQVIGVALYKKSKITLSHEMSLIIAKDFLNTRLPYELAETLIKDASTHRIQTLYTKDDSTDNHMLNLAQKMGMSVRIEKDTTGRNIVYSLQVDEHPGVVRF